MNVLMSSQPRFVTVRDLYRAFPTAEIDVGIDVCDEASLSFARRLGASGNARAGLSYCAYLLARREAVWWGAQCIRQTELRAPCEAECLAAAEAWVREPDEPNRRRALERGSQSPNRAPTTWIALAAAWSGGNMAENNSYRVAPPPQATAQAVRGAVLLAIARLPIASADQTQSDWVNAALRYAVGDFRRA